MRSTIFSKTFYKCASAQLEYSGSSGRADKSLRPLRASPVMLWSVIPEIISFPLPSLTSHDSPLGLGLTNPCTFYLKTAYLFGPSSGTANGRPTNLRNSASRMTLGFLRDATLRNGPFRDISVRTQDGPIFEAEFPSRGPGRPASHGVYVTTQPHFQHQYESPGSGSGEF